MQSEARVVFAVLCVVVWLALFLIWALTAEAQEPVVWNLSYNWRPVLIGVTLQGCHYSDGVIAPPIGIGLYGQTLCPRR